MSTRSDPGASGRSADLLLAPGPIRPSEDTRLSLSWHRQRTAALVAHLEATGRRAVLLTDQWNIVYFTGLWAATTERPLYALISVDADAPLWFHPTLDRDLVHTWWCGDAEEYFDFPHVAGSFPNRGVAERGPRADLWRWTLERLRARGHGPDGGLCTDRELLPSQQATAEAVLGHPLDSIAGFCLGLRMRKTPEELALAARAYGYFDAVHAHGRDLLLEHGTSLTDHELRGRMADFAVRLITPDLGLDGSPHRGVGVAIDLGWIRAGQVTGWPHPNQYRYAPITRGGPLQMSGVIRIGGYGGECYRPYLIAPRTRHQERLWQVARDSCLLQREEMRAGVTCAEVAQRIHRFQIAQGVAEHVYHRPAHGQGSEGHQPPWLSLGDDTVLEPGMCLSVEPGLYDPAAGFSANFSDMFVVRESGPAAQMSRVPWTEEWCWADL
ncbi:M24 family metallopeptidase [Nonomuraea sp. MG754425]|uniref:M24 family metallopeptidase n=1 Tax=Nonomuraea sp. MG754425 TaxID=2570319 RepID=UPI001F2A183B|nr:M24 family metallopeptidase [Nonomuraea sp. MG754425]MCF6474340.1 M24 family metallopeptidase [Nonomuraea sp. MG754425]